MLLELLPGGDLHALLAKEGRLHTQINIYKPYPYPES